MAIIGFNFTKIHAEKRVPIRGQVSINNNVSLIGVEDAGIGMAQTKKGLKLRFGFKSSFEPGHGAIELEGEVIILEDAKVAESVLDQWAKSKSLPANLMPSVLNNILERANIQALILARDIGLPSPVQLPKVNVQAKPMAAVKPAAAPKAEEKKDEKKKAKK